VIAYGWADLFPPNGGALHDIRGVAPNRRFVVTASDPRWFGDDAGIPPGASPPASLSRTMARSW